MFEQMPLNDQIRLAHAGGGWELEAGFLATNDLVRLANAASSGNGRLVLTGLNFKPVEDLIRIAHAGKGSVFFKS